MHPDVVRFVQLLAEPAFLVTAAGEILVANSASVQLTRMGAHDLVGKHLTTIVAESAEKVLEYVRLCSRSRQLLPGSVTLVPSGQPAVEVRCDGAVLITRSESSPPVVFLRCRPKNETTDQFVLLNQKIASLSREILERRKAVFERNELLKSERAARVEAERISRMKDEFLATLSHELRTPLNAILGWSQILLRPGERDAEDLVEGLHTIERNARAQTRLIEDLLDMSRIISGKIRLDVQRVELAPIIDAAVASVRPGAEAKGVRLQVTLDPIAGPVRGDPNRLQQVVWNLLSNAVKFTPRGGRVQVLLERVNSHLEIVVSDTGEGIKPEFLPHLFERFRQSDATTTRRHGGLGLGLSIVSQLAQLHGGAVRAKSPGVGKGSTFTVMLPLAVLHEQEEASEAPPRAHPGGVPSADQPCEFVNLAGLSILVVDDEPDARELVRRFLMSCQATVVTAASAEEALAVLSAQPVDVIISDIGMPEVDGYELMRRVRSHSDGAHGRIPAIALTAFARSEDRTRAMLAGYNAHLAKPIEPVELAATVASLTGRTGMATSGT